MSSTTLEVRNQTGSTPLNETFYVELDQRPTASEKAGQADIPASETVEQELPDVKQPVLSIKLPATPHYRPEKAWLGTVTEILDDGFEARLQDLSGASDLVSEFSYEEISLEDRELVAVGAEFYWNLGYKDNLNGQRERYALLRFRRLPKFTARQIEASRETARNLLAELR